MPLPKELFTVSNLFTLICTSLTCYLLAQVVIKFAITKPTSTSEELVELDLTTFPDVVVCLDPPFDLDALASFGYKPTDYFSGRVDGSFVGWNGADGKYNSTHILNSVLAVKTDEDMFNHIYFYDQTGKSTSTTAQFRMMLYPYGRCLLVKPRGTEISFKNLWLVFKAANWSSDIHMNVFLVDPINSPVIFPDFFQMKGVQMRIPIQKNTFNSFVIRTLRSYQVEGNPTFPCNEYNQDQNWANLIFKLNDVPKPNFGTKRKIILLYRQSPIKIATSLSSYKRESKQGPLLLMFCPNLSRKIPMESAYRMS